MAPWLECPIIIGPSNPARPGPQTEFHSLDPVIPLRRFENRRLYSTGILIAVAAVLLVLAAMIVLGEYTKTLGRFLLTAVILGGYFLVSWAGSSPAGGWSLRWVSRPALGFAAAALAILLFGVWGTPDSDGFWKTAAIVSILPLGIILIGRRLGSNYIDLPRRLASLVSAGVLAAGMVLAGLGIAAEIKVPAYWWAFTLLMLVWATTAVAVPLLSIRRSH